MEIAWLNKKRELGDSIGYTCPSKTTTWEEKLVEQVVKCIWHRQTDSMIWWPPELHNCNRKNLIQISCVCLRKRFTAGSESKSNKSKVRNVKLYIADTHPSLLTTKRIQSKLVLDFY